MTLRGTLVMLLALAVATGAPAGAAEEGPDVGRALRQLVRPALPTIERLDAAAVVLASEVLPDPSSAVRGATLLLDEAPDVATWLLLRGLEASWIEPEVREQAREAVVARLEGQPEAEGAARAAWAAAGLLLGHRPAPGVDDLLAAWPPSAAVGAVLDREVAVPGGSRPADADPSAVRAALDAQRPTATALDDAAVDDLARARRGLDALVEEGVRALDLLLHTIAWQTDHPRAGRLGRATRAVVAVGLIGDRRATPTLLEALDAPEGWMQAAAAVALGDVGDPAAAIGLCRKITYRGDLLRDRDRWDYPYSRPTDVAPEDWPSVPYFAVDCLAADALLRLGAGGAAGWLIERKLDPSVANFRIRVLHEAVDAIRRNVPDAPIDGYVVDAGWPARAEAFRALHAWWREHRFERVTPEPFDADDAGFRREARAAAERLRGRSIMELMIVQDSSRILGPAMTPTLRETLVATESLAHRLVIIETLGMVRDPAAVGALLTQLGDGSATVRAKAANALGAYASADDRVVPALLDAIEAGDPGVRLAAAKSLVHARPQPALPETVARSGDAAGDREWTWTLDVLRLVHAGDGAWPAVRAWLVHEERYVRRDVWDLVRRALDLPASAYDASADPATPGWAEPDETAILEAAARRRAL